MTQPDPLVGTTLGGCQIIDVIGRGGMGVIYKARQLSLDRVVAMKVLAPKLANDFNFVTRFQREARAIARVNHPNILAVYDVGSQNDTYYMIMELIDGESVAEVQAHINGPLRFEDACNYIKQAALGLEAAHASGITHRDVKPENLLLTKKGVIKVSDFGLATDADQSTTSTDAVMGTPAFMSPEQCDGRKVTQRSDIYSLGGSFYRLVTGRLPFEAETAMSMMYRHKHEALVPPREIVPALAAAINGVIVKMMAKKPEDRYASMGDVVTAIDQSLKGEAAEIARRPPRGAPAEELKIVLPAPPPPRWSTEGAAGESADAGGSDMVEIAPADAPPPGADLPPRGASARLGGGAGQGLTERFPRGEFARGQAGSSGHMAPAFLAGLTEDAFSLARRGDEMLQRGDRVGALKLYRQALQAGGLDGATLQRLEKELQTEAVTRRQTGENLLRRGMLMEASREFRMLLDLDPKDDAVRASLKEIEQKLATKRNLINDIRSAIGAQQFEQAISMWDRTPLDLREEGLGKQIEHLRTVILPSVKLCEQGEHYNSQGRLEEALSTFQDALRIDETCERARQGLGEVEGKLHRIELMLKEGYELSLKQDYGRAIDVWKPILRLRPNHPQALKSILESSQALAQAERARGDLRAALKVLATAREVDPQNRGIIRLHDELVELSEKEQALTDRANEAAANGRTGEAIRYWHEVLRTNPANATAQEHIRVLGKERGKRLLRISVVFGLVAIIFLTSYQYLIEYLALRKVEECERNLEYATALDVLRETYFIYNRGQVSPLRRRLQFRYWESQAEEAEKDGQLDKAAEILMQAAESSDAGEHMARLQVKAFELRIKNRMSKGEAALKAEDWDKAREEFKQARRLAQDAKAQNQFVESISQCERNLMFIDKLQQGLTKVKEGQPSAALQLLQEAKKIRPDSAFVDKLMKEHGFNQDQFDDQLKAAMKALGEPWRPEALREAMDALGRARRANPIGPRLDVLTRFAEDALKCDGAGMVLVTNKKPQNADFVWTASDRRETESFCIDRYEYPNKAGQVPEAGSTWLEAKNRCQKVGKELCTWRQWAGACGAKEYSTWTFGPVEVPGACNWQGGQAKPSGSFSQCHNQIGAYDMNGNLAEWTLDGDRDTEAYQAGGSFNSGGAQSARCAVLDRRSRSKDQGTPDAGFRCCKPLGQE
jgi:tetratricopeptide (TPR) repeat protein